MSIRFKKDINSPSQLLRWDSGSYNTYYFYDKEEFEENKNALESISQNYSTWTDRFNRYCLQILQ